MNKRICATSRITWSIFLVVSLLCLTGGIMLCLCQQMEKALVLVPCALYLLGVSVYHLTHTKFMDADGIACYRFGKSIRFLAWSDIGQVCIVKRHSISAGGSGEDFIIVVPNWCAPYAPPTSGDSYLLEHHDYAISLDHTKQNIAFISQVWGPVMDYRYARKG